MQTNDWVISRERVCTPMRLSEPVQEQSIELDYTLPDYFPDFFRLLHCFAEPRITAQKTVDDAVQYTLTTLRLNCSFEQFVTPLYYGLCVLL